MTMKSQFFTSKRKPASYYRGSREVLVPSGIKLIHRGESVGGIVFDKASNEYQVHVVNRANKLFMSEFKTFAEADRFAWLSATSA